MISGGSSVGARDLTLSAIQDLPGAEVLVHGVALRPGKPTILAALGQHGFSEHATDPFTRLDLNPIITTLGTMSVTRGLGYVLGKAFRNKDR